VYIHQADETLEAVVAFAAGYGFLLLPDPDENFRFLGRAMVISAVVGGSLFAFVYIACTADVPQWWALSNSLLVPALIGSWLRLIMIAHNRRSGAVCGLLGIWFAASTSIAVFAPWPVWGKVLAATLAPALIFLSGFSATAGRGLQSLPQAIFWQMVLLGALGTAGWAGTAKHWWLLGVATFAVIGVASIAAQNEERAQSAAWGAVVAYVDARTPPGDQVKTTRENLRITAHNRVEIDMVLAGRIGSDHGVTNATAILARDQGRWQVLEFRESSGSQSPCQGGNWQ